MSGATAGPTWTTHFSDDPRTGGVPTEDRFIGAHARCLSNTFRSPVAAKPVAFLFMGAPGSGKTRLRHFFQTVRGATAFTLIDPDDFKRQLPEFAALGAEAVHEESSWIARQARCAAMGRQCGVMNDAVGSDVEKYAELIRRLKLNEYAIELGCIHLEDLDEVIRRVAYRAHKTGREVPLREVRAAHGKIPAAFQQLSRIADAAFLFNGARNGGLAWETVSGTVRMHDQEFVNRLGLVLPS